MKKGYHTLEIKTDYGNNGEPYTVLESYKFDTDSYRLPLEKAREILEKYETCDYDVYANIEYIGYDATGRKYKRNVWGLDNKGWSKNYLYDSNDVYIEDSKQLKHNNMKRIKDNEDGLYIQQSAKELDKYAAIDRPLYEDMEDSLRSNGFILNDELHLYKNDSDWKEYWTLADGNESEGLIVWGGSDSDHNPVVYSVRRANKSDFTAWKNRELEAEKHYRQVQGVSDSRKPIRSIARRIKDSVNIRKRISDAKEKFFNNDLKRMQAYRRVTDSEGKIKENVVFLIEDSDVLAVFPNTYGTANRDRDTMVCYSHNGQHGVCTYDYANTLKTADSKKYNELKDELTNYVGYNLTIVDSLPSETELKQNAREIRDAYTKFKRGLQIISDERMLARGEEIEYNGKRGTVQYALFHGTQPVVIRWQNEDGSEEFEIPYNEVSKLKIHDSEDEDVNVEPVDNDSDIDDTEVTDGCGGKGGKKKAKKTADAVKKVKIFKRTKKSE